MNRQSTLEERFWAKVDRRGPDECWEWKAAKFRRGYGVFVISHGHPTGAHRMSWRLHFGNDPGDLCVLHKCDNPPCVNPAHLFLGTRGDNARDMCAKGRQRCQIDPASVRGERNPRAKLTVDQVSEIRRRAQAGESQTALALEFPVSRSMIGSIVRVETWQAMA